MKQLRSAGMETYLTIINRQTAGHLSRIAGNAGFNFLNQNVLQDRLRYIGFLEYNRIRLVLSVYKHSKDFPKEETYGLTHEAHCYVIYYCNETIWRNKL